MNKLRSKLKSYLRKGSLGLANLVVGLLLSWFQRRLVRGVVDVRALNKITINNDYPLPRIDDFLDELNDVVCFNKLFLGSFYH